MKFRKRLVVIEKCSSALSYYDRQNLEYEIERLYKIEQGYDKMGLNWAFTDEDRRNMRWLKEEAVEWVLLLEAIPIISSEIKKELEGRFGYFVDGKLEKLIVDDYGYYGRQGSIKEYLDYWII